MINKKLIIFTGPSGVGKSALEKLIFANEKLALHLAVSATTREPRAGEKEGIHYYFISHEAFVKKIKNHEFVEWNKHFSNLYGTLKSEIKRIMDLGKNPFLEVETIGALNIMQAFPQEQIISFFIKPPSLDELKKRIAKRGSETKEQIKQRMKRVNYELSFAQDFDYQITNENVEQTAAKIAQIILKKGHN